MPMTPSLVERPDFYFIQDEIAIDIVVVIVIVCCLGRWQVQNGRNMAWSALLLSIDLGGHVIPYLRYNCISGLVYSRYLI